MAGTAGVRHARDVRELAEMSYRLTVIVQTERHSYEKCQYEEFKKRVAKMDELRAAKGGERSN